MSTENLDNISRVTPKVDMDILRQRLLDQQKKDKTKRTIVFSTVFASIGILAILVG